ncbi:MAG TPA: hypothetical protein P5181_02755 [Dermatophilaceae bacterium]|nr:hypothetical protein [Dermatophilaceae bacterium]
MAEPGRPRRPVFLDAAAMEEHGEVVDPVQQIEAAHQSAAVLVGTGRAAHDPEVTARLVALVEQVGLSTVADLWSERPARSLPGALWRLYALREWVRQAPLEASREYAAGVRHTVVSHAVAGAAEPPGPDELAELLDAVLRGVFEGDLAVALERAAAFCRVVSAGRADVTEGQAPADQAASLLETAADLDAAAALWRQDRLV